MMMLPGGGRNDRWLLPYADFVTLLFAVFVMMYALEKAHAKRPVVPAPARPVACVPPVPPLAAHNPLLDDLRTNLDAENQDGFLTLSADLRGVVIALNDQTLFRPGEARIAASAEASFDTIGRVLNRYPNHILLEGHTDSVPIHNAQFQSNWELSTARSMAVMQLLERRALMPSSRFSIGGSADNSPVTMDSTEPGRARNRRVEIVVLENPPERGPGTTEGEVPRTPSAELAKSSPE